MSSADERQFSRPMIRVGKYGLIRPWNLTSVRLQMIVRGPSVFLSVSFWLSLLAVCLSFGWSMAALAQTDVNDVHVMPRPVEKAKTEEVAKESMVSPSLNTHVRPLKVAVDLVLVPVTITDPMNRLVTGLEKENFQLFEGSAGQEIKTFSSEDAPVSLGVIFDSSGSMSSKMDRAKDAVVEFFKTANPQDEFFMITFSDEPENVIMKNSSCGLAVLKNSTTASFARSILLLMLPLESKMTPNETGASSLEKVLISCPALPSKS